MQKIHKLRLKKEVKINLGILVKATKEVIRPVDGLIPEGTIFEFVDEDFGAVDPNATIEEEEKSAIQDGMKALSLFYDPKEARQSSDGTACFDNEPLGFDNDDALMDHGYEDVIGDNCYFYASAEGDVFNQRPLPFIVGSSEFMESSCAGLDAVEDET